jgi:hypothetical protein
MLVLDNGLTPKDVGWEGVVQGDVTHKLVNVILPAVPTFTILI